MTTTQSGDPRLLAHIETSRGVLVVHLFEDIAPLAVANFVGLATGEKEWRHPGTGRTQTGRPLYDGTCFHRVIPNFIIQAGDPFSNPADGDDARIGQGEPGYRFADEISATVRFDRPGRLAMANANMPDTNGCQWFITEVAAPHLNGRHTIFGEVVKGFEIVPKIARSPADERHRPLTPVLVQKISVIRGT